MHIDIDTHFIAEYDYMSILSVIKVLKQGGSPTKARLLNYHTSSPCISQTGDSENII